MGHSPRSLFNWAILAADFCRSAGSFIPALRYESLEIHKVFLRLSTLPCEKISRCPIDPPHSLPCRMCDVFHTVGRMILHVLYNLEENDHEIFRIIKTQPYFPTALRKPGAGQWLPGAVCTEKPHRRKSCGYHREIRTGARDDLFSC